jgi:hypothetical protein
MGQRTSNRPFEFWEVWDERLPFGSRGYRIIALFHDF